MAAPPSSTTLDLSATWVMVSIVYSLLTSNIPFTYHTEQDPERRYR